MFAEAVNYPAGPVFIPGRAGKYTFRPGRAGPVNKHNHEQYLQQSVKETFA